jgi:N-methylhydantoinase B
MNTIALVTTHGFADVLSLGRQNRPDPYTLHVGPSLWTQALPDAWRIGLRGRIDAEGREVEPLELSALGAAISALPAPPSAVAVSLMFADRNPAHEREVQEALASLLPGVTVVCSHALAGKPEWGEYEWAVATVQKAGARPAPPQVHQHEHADPLAGQLEALCNGMQHTLVQQAVSSVVREAMDCAAAVFLPDGRMLAQARSLPLLLGSLTPAVLGMLADYPVRDMREGDIFVSNDPWRGGTHFPDWVLLQPVVVEGQVRALVACILHHQDVGGISAGSVPTEARSSFQEGLRLPPVRWVREGVADVAWTRLFTANSRMPTNLEGDLSAQRACLAMGEAAMRALVSRLGSTFEAQAERLWQATAQATRDALAQAPDGRYAFCDALDGDGITDALVAIEVVLEKRGDALTIDLRGCADQAEGPVNASRGAVWAAVTYFARMLAPESPSNGACTEPIRLLTREGSIVDPRPGAAVNARTNLVKLLANALLGAWAQAMPQQKPAANAGVAVVLSLSGDNAGRPWILTEIIASAAGGAPWAPGGSGVSTDVGNARNTPARVLESKAPLRMEQVAIRKGSGGVGQHAGGCGVVRRYRLLAGTGHISYRGERHRTQAQGAAGGQAGRSGSARIERADGTVHVLPAKARATWRAGDLLVIETAGAGGWGPPDDAPQREQGSQ